VAGGVWICPGSPVSTGPTAAYPNARMYVWPDENGDHLRSNTYAGLYYHITTDHSWRNLVGGVPTKPSVSGPTWRRTYFKGHEFAAPLQWCSVRLTPGEDARGLDCRSWHWPDGRPTLFVDGHVAVLNN